jgi:hypothetical protein
MKRTSEAGWLPTTLPSVPYEGARFHTPGTGGNLLYMLFARGMFGVIKRPGYNDTEGIRRRFHPVVYMLVEFRREFIAINSRGRLEMRVLDRAEPGRSSDSTFQRLCGRALRLANGTEAAP